MITAKQREARRKWIGASDVPAILGLSPYRTALGIWYEKIGEMEPFEGNEATSRGDYLEPALLSYAQDALKLPVYKPRGTFKAASHPFIRANVDGLVGSPKRGSPIIECKSSMVEWGDEVPEHVRAQVQAQLFATESSDAYVAYIGPNLKFDLYPVCRDDVWIAGMVDVLTEFWSMVRSRTKPDPHAWGGLKQDDVLVSRGTDTELGEAEIPEHALSEWRETRDALAAAEASHQVARERIRGYLGHHTKGVCPGWSVSYHTQKRTSIDTRSLESEHPDIAERFRRVCQFPVLRIKESK